jgi:hypothetical protein
MKILELMILNDEITTPSCLSVATAATAAASASSAFAAAWLLASLAPSTTSSFRSL